MKPKSLTREQYSKILAASRARSVSPQSGSMVKPSAGGSRGHACDIVVEDVTFTARGYGTCEIVR
jgi:hypothetical protein